MTNTTSVYLFNVWAATPTYHAYGHIRDKSADVTICGRLMYDTETRYAARLRQDHADLFAKPCRRCFVVSEEHA